METRRQQVNEAEMSSMEKRMEDVKENIRKAEVSLLVFLLACPWL